MPQMNKGGKWVFGWCVVGPGGEIQIPHEAYTEYGFRIGELLLYLHGSRRSGGFSVGRIEKLAAASPFSLRRVLGQGVMLEEEQIAVPAGAGIQPGERLLAIRGSGYALLFIRFGPIFEEAVKRPAIDVYGVTPNLTSRL